ncbi:carbonic anhydrase [uncultured Pseudodesulfovibrio sp.]|uniref:carbonic anhydrase n=1 Tax=uncultured Pseudodesulfovibrio sp. TaxID=2035858 RepID=UPI0029C7FD70|nr:carbonic anhydrase [uncultured Pseudodesulfovibrio sp.]
MNTMRKSTRVTLVCCFIVITTMVGAVGKVTASSGESKPTPDEVVDMLKKGNSRFAAGQSIHEHTDLARLKQAGSENQGDHAYATVLACSDSRVPVERLFDAGVMDLFVVRVAGNVVQTDEAGSIEYGLAHVNTPVLVVLGHSQCGAVAAVTSELLGNGHELERNIVPLVAPIIPAVKRAMHDHADAPGMAVVPYAIEENVWQSIEDLFMVSPATREIIKAGRAKVVGAVYDVGTGEVMWLPEVRVSSILDSVEQNPARAMNVMAVPK